MAGPLVQGFGWLDYSVFALMLGLSVAVGVWFGVCGRKRNIAAADYLLGGRSMHIAPVAVSLVASHISGITLMGAPAEIYIHGAQYILVCFSAVFMGFIIDRIYLPVFYGLQLTSTYEYLHRRFNRTTRLMASFLFTLQLVLILPIFVYVPSLAFAQVSGVSLHLVSLIVCVVCIFYTMLGGLKAVVWTDFLQAIVMMGAVVTVMVLGIVAVGGTGRIWELSSASGRLDVVWDPNPLVRNTVWTVVVGATASWLCGCGVNQGTVQKFLSLPTLRSARLALISFAVGIIIIKLLTSYAGLLMYAAYHDCDPLRTGDVKRPDQLLPHYVMETAGHIPGLPGLFIAGVFSAALSSMSSSLNSLAGTLYEDFVAPCLKGKLSDQRVNFIMQFIVGLVGAICVALVFVVERLGAVLELAYSVNGITGGALLGLFTLGMVCPWANSKGALAGSGSALLFMSWVVLGSQHAHATGRIHDTWFPSSLDGCAANVTEIPDYYKHEPIPPGQADPTDEVFPLYRLSFMYYGLAGTLVVMVVGLLVSLATGPTRPSRLDPRLLAPCVRHLANRSRAASASELASPEEKAQLPL